MTNTILGPIFVIVLTFMLLSDVSICLAWKDPTELSYDIEDIKVIINRVANAIAYLSGFIAAMYLAWGGFKYSASQGHPGRQAEAKQTMFNACTGLAIVLLARVIISIVAKLVEL